MRQGLIAVAILVSYLLLYEPMSSSAAENPISRYSKILENMKTHVDLEEKFFENLRTIYLKSSPFETIIFIGGSTESLDKAKPVFEDCPVIVCTNLASCSSYRKSFNPGILVVVFIDRISEETLSENDVILSCKWCGIFYITAGKMDDKKMISLMRLYKKIERKMRRVILAKFDNKSESVKIYSYVFTTNCIMEIELINLWTPGKRFDIFNGWSKQWTDFKGCPVFVGTCYFEPKMITEELEDGSQVITGGSEGYLLLTLAENLNFTMVVKSPSKSDQIKYSRRTSIVNELTSGKVDIVVDGLRATIGVENSHYSMAYDSDCVVWTVPRKTSWANDIPFVIFGWKIWSLIGLVYVAVCLFVYINQKIYLPRTRIERHVEFSMMIFDVLALHLGNPIVDVPLFTEGRIFLMLCLYYALVITTAFKTSLASILVKDSGSQVITDDEGIIRANLSVGGASYNLDFLKDQVNESDTVSKLVDKFVVINEPKKALDRLKLDSNFAFITRRSSIAYQIKQTIKAREPIYYMSLNDCVLKYHTVILARDDFRLLKSINGVIMRLYDSGILNHWSSIEINFDKETNDELNNRHCFESCINEKFRNLFFLYLRCINFSILIFLVELFIKKYLTN